MPCLPRVWSSSWELEKSLKGFKYKIIKFGFQVITLPRVENAMEGPRLKQGNYL